MDEETSKQITALDDIWATAVNSKKIFLVDRDGDYCAIDARALDDMLHDAKRRKITLPAMWKRKENTVTIMLEKKSGFSIRDGKLSIST